MTEPETRPDEEQPQPAKPVPAALGGKVQYDGPEAEDHWNERIWHP